ncbi:hypothetical protein K3495_g14107 [Podosphaera aphanis]|nr:hypothetical protein K3495_g14107 [Podosphaera aphanis]
MNTPEATTTPIRYSNRFSQEQRIRVLALYEARHTNREISDLLGISVNQVKYTMQTGCITPGKSSGRPPVFSNEQEDEVEVFVCRDKNTRQMSYLELSIHFYMWTVGQDAIRNTLRRRGYPRYLAQSKPPLTEKHQIFRMQWAQRRFNFTFEDWCKVVWTDETYISDGPGNKSHVTRKASLNVCHGQQQFFIFKKAIEEYNSTCLIERQRKNNSWISGVVLQEHKLVTMFFGREIGAR